MINLDFWYMFLGFLLLLASVPSIIAPDYIKKIFKKMFKDENHLRTVSVWYLSVGPALIYSGWGAGSSLSANLLLVIGTLFIVQGLLLFFATDWYQSAILKKVLGFSNLSYKLVGSLKFILALVLLYSGFFFV